MIDCKAALDFLNQWDFELREMEQFNDNKGVVDVIRQALTAQSWMPISSAPRDGTSILISYPTKLRDDIKSIEDISWYSEGVWRLYRGHFLTQEYTTTHWMPLPAPPENKGG